jgi:hypothetical protein
VGYWGCCGGAFGDARVAICLITPVLLQAWQQLEVLVCTYSVWAKPPRTCRCSPDVASNTRITGESLNVTTTAAPPSLFGVRERLMLALHVTM